MANTCNDNILEEDVEDNNGEEPGGDEDNDKRAGTMTTANLRVQR